MEPVYNMYKYVAALPVRETLAPRIKQYYGGTIERQRTHRYSPLRDIRIIVLGASG